MFIPLGLTFNECIKDEIWTFLSEKINCTCAFFREFIPTGASKNIEGKTALDATMDTTRT